MIQNTLFVTQNIILGQLKMGEHRAKCRAMLNTKQRLWVESQVNINYISCSNVSYCMCRSYWGERTDQCYWYLLSIAPLTHHCPSEIACYRETWPSQLFSIFFLKHCRQLISLIIVLRKQGRHSFLFFLFVREDIVLSTITILKYSRVHFFSNSSYNRKSIQKFLEKSMTLSNLRLKTW